MSEVEKPEEIKNLKENDTLNESKCLLILNLQRPFISQNLEALLNKYGKVQRFWLDFIKTHCYVEVSKKYKKFYGKIINYKFY
jgi:apoptotic chromatin condensation inducer in the nucleus